MSSPRRPAFLIRIWKQQELTWRVRFLLPTITTASAASGDSPNGIYVSGSVVDISNSTATGSGSAVNTGIGVTGGSQATINDVTATGSGVDGNTSRGIAVDGNSTVLNAFNTKARGSTGEDGFWRRDVKRGGGFL